MKTIRCTAAIAAAAFALGGVCAVRSSVRPVHASTIAPLPGGPPDTLVATPSASTIRWEGAGGSAAGRVALASGLFVLRHEKLTSGSFTIDMRSLAVSTAPAALSGRALRARLTGRDFFDVDRHPVTSFTSSGMERLGPSRWRVHGRLTMHGVTQPLSLDTDVRWVGTGHMVATSSFVIDRRRWEVGTSSATGAVLGDELRVSVTLDARRKPKVVAAR